jgi:hypothetical protein
MKKSNSALTKFAKVYAKDLRDMEFCPEDSLYKLSTKELYELKQSVKNTNNALSDPGIEALFLKLKKIFIRQTLESVDNAEVWRQEEIEMKRAIEQDKKAKRIKQNMLKKIKSKLSKEELGVLGL